MAGKDRDKISIKELLPWEKNPRRITDENLGRLAKSIRDFTETLPGWKLKDGFRIPDPIIYNRKLNRMTGGHQRLRALGELGQEWIHQDDIRYIEADERLDHALNIALNNPNLQGEWDMDKLETILNLMKEEKTDLSLTGFTEVELEAILSLEEGFGFAPPEGDASPLDFDPGALGGTEGKGFVCLVTFETVERAEAFLEHLKCEDTKFKENTNTKMVYGDKIEF